MTDAPDTAAETIATTNAAMTMKVKGSGIACARAGRAGAAPRAQGQFR